MAYVTRLNQGYMDGLYNREINSELSNHPGSEYDEGYLVGCEDRAALKLGSRPPKLLGFYEESDLPIKAGQEVIIKKGTVVKVIGREPKPAGRTYRIKVNHVGNGSTFYVRGNAFRKEYVRPTPPVVVWAGPGGLWASADMNDFLEPLP